MSSSLVGLAVNPARSLSNEISSWIGLVTDINVLVVEAEMLSDLPTVTTPVLDQISDDARLISQAISVAADTIESHKSELVGFRPLIRRRKSTSVGSDESPDARRQRQVQREKAAAEAQAALDQIQAISAEGQAPHPSVEEHLRNLFGTIIEDDVVAAAALGFALNGLPASQALQLESEFDVDSLLSELAEAMQVGMHPSELGDRAELFPQAYRDWHELNDSIAHYTSAIANERNTMPKFELWALQGRINDLFEQRNELEVAGFDQDASGIGDHGGLGAFAAISAVARELGSATHGWAGAQYAPTDARWSDEHTRRIGEIAVGRQGVAVGLFNQLGASGTGGLPTLFDAGGVEHLKSMTALYSQSLAQVSGPRLSFSGRDLIEQNTFESGTPVDLHSPAEFMLVADGFDQDFLIDAVATSLRIRDKESYLWVQDPVTNQGIDPRLAALAALALNDASPALVHRLSESDELDLLLMPEPTGSYGIQSPNLPNAELLGGLSAAHLAIAQIGLDPRAVQTVIDHLNNNPRRYQLGSDRDIKASNLGVVNGLSSMLALGAPSDVHRGATSHDKFFAVYDMVVRSGGGFELAIVGSALLFEHEVQRQLETATNPADVDLTAVGDFVKQGELIRLERLRNSSELRDRTASNYQTVMGGLSLAASGVSLGAGFAAGAAAFFGPLGAGAALLGLLFGGLSLRGGDDDNLEDYHQQAHLEALATQPNVNRQLLIGTLASGVVVTQSGHRVTLVEASLDQNYERTFDVYVGGQFLHSELRHSGTVTFGETAWMDDMWVGQESLTNFAARLDTIAAPIDEARAEQEHQASSGG